MLKIAESELIERLRARDILALNYLYDSYSAALFGVILRIVKSQSIAEEILQDTFSKAWNKFDYYNPDKGRIYTWLVNISRNLAIDKLRSKEFSARTKSDSLDTYVYSSNIPEDTDSSSDYIGLKEIVMKLNPDQQQVVDLIYFQGFSHSQVSEKYGIPLGTVKTRIKTALSKLRILLKESH